MNSTLSRTNAIGTGTRNIPVNVPVDERDFWNDLAKDIGAKSVGELHRVLWLVGLRQTFPEKAEQLKEIRRRYYGAAFLLLFSGVLALSWAQSFAPRSVRSAARPCRIAKARRDNLEFDDFTGGVVAPTFDEIEVVA